MAKGNDDDNDDYDLDPMTNPPLFNAAKFIYCDKVKTAMGKLGQRLYADERLADFCALKVALYDQGSQASISKVSHKMLTVRFESRPIKNFFMSATFISAFKNF